MFVRGLEIAQWIPRPKSRENLVEWILVAFFLVSPWLDHGVQFYRVRNLLIWTLHLLAPGTTQAPFFFATIYCVIC